MLRSETGMERFGWRAELDLGAGRHAHAECDGISSPFGRQAKQPGAPGSGADTPDGRGVVPSHVVVSSAYSSTKYRLHFQSHHVGIEQISPSRAFTLGKREQRGDEHRGCMIRARREHIIAFKTQMSR